MISLKTKNSFPWQLLHVSFLLFVIVNIWKSWAGDSGRSWESVESDAGGGSTASVAILFSCWEGPGWPSHRSYNLARTFIHLCAAITSRDEYCCRIVCQPVRLPPSRFDLWAVRCGGCEVCEVWGVWGVWGVAGGVVLCKLISRTALVSVHILSHCQSDKQQKAWAEPVLSQCWAAVKLLVSDIRFVTATSRLTLHLRTERPVQDIRAGLVNVPLRGVRTGADWGDWLRVSPLYQGTLTFLLGLCQPQAKFSFSLFCCGGDCPASGKINLKFLACFHYLSAMLVIEQSQ